MRSSAPCKISVAATLSITSARRRREASASSRDRSAAAVDSRSSHKQDRQRREPAKVAREGAGGLGAWAVRAIEVDRQTDDEARRPRARLASASRRAASAANCCGASVTRPEAMVRVTSDSARPSVLLPTSMPIRRAPAEARWRTPRASGVTARAFTACRWSLARCNLADHLVCVVRDRDPYTRPAQRGHSAEEASGMKIIWYGHSCFRHRDRQQRASSSTPS